MKLILKKGVTSKILHIFIQDSSKTDGSGLTGLTYNSSGLTAYYIREGDASPTAITLASATVGTYTSGGFVEVDATNMPGIYEFDPPDACFASGADSVVIFLKGATNMALLPIEVQLRDNTEKDIYDRIGSPVSASISVDIQTIDSNVDSIKAQTDKMQFNGSNNIQARVNDKGVLNDPSASDIDTQLSSTHGSGSWEKSSASDIADAVWNEPLSNHTITGTFGKTINTIKSIVNFIRSMIL